MRIIPQEHPDSILIDWVSEGDGEAELCKEVRALAPEASVYLFTGVATGQEVKLGMLALQGERIESLSVDDFVDALFEDSKTMCGRPRGVPAQNRDVVH